MQENNFENLILIKGAGDLASGVAARLFRCGYPVIMTELPAPLMVRRTVSFGEAVYESIIQVEGITAQCVGGIEEARQLLNQRVIPILVDPEAACRIELQPAVFIDAIMAKRNTGTRITDSPCVIALGPGFTAGQDCHMVIETNRGHNLGRIITFGSAEADTGSPGNIVGKTEERILRAPISGIIETKSIIGDRVLEGQVIALIDEQPVKASISGVLRGLLRSGLKVAVGTKIGDIDPRAETSHCWLISEKAYAIAGGVLEAVLSSGILPVRKK